MKPVFALLALAAALTPLSHAAEFKVLAVLSYEENNPWCKEIREGIDTVLGKSAEVTYFHMNTKVDRAGGPKRAEEALALYQQLQPHGVIAADDDAQGMFVVPYLKGRVSTPIMFNGVNAAPDKYGYPTPHISGTLERAHVRESLAFAKQLFPDIHAACFLTNNVPPGIALRTQVEAERSSYPTKVQAFHLVKNQAELESVGKTLRGSCDTVFVDSLEGIAQTDGAPMDNRTVLNLLSRLYKGPILGGNRYQVEQGAWAAVVKTGQEQGEIAAEMLLQAMRGVPVEKLPVTRNNQGRRVINVTALESRGIHLKPLLLRGAELVRQDP